MLLVQKSEIRMTLVLIDLVEFSHLITQLAFTSSKLKIETLEPDNPVGIYLLKVNNRNTRTRCEIFSKLIVKTLSGV